jgi:orotidine-5'-phosphate decarboxylase
MGSPSAVVRSVGPGLKNPIIVALDVDSRDEALQIADQLADHVGAFKVGPRLCLRYGASLCSELAQRAPLFVDNKHLDIPATMVAAVKASFDVGATLVTIHASAGADALSEVAKLEKNLTQIRPFQVLAVTVLTSYSEDNLPTPWKNQSIPSLVASLFKDAYLAGIRGFVGSPLEVAAMRSEGPDTFLVTPGIRPSSSGVDDQKRTSTPSAAMKNGAGALVIGRPILEAKDRLQAIKSILADIKNSAQ